MAKPEDMTCLAVDCEKRKTFSEELDTWVDFCSTHFKEDEKARKEGKPRVQKDASK